MILNHAEDIQRGAVPTDFVYRGSVLVWQRQKPVDNGKVNLFQLDEYGNPISTLYFDILSEAKNYILQHSNEKFWCHVGANARTSVMTYEMFAGVAGLVKFTNDSNRPSSPVPYISEGAFSGSPDLKEVSMKGIYYIDNYAFKDCPSLETVTIELNGIRPQEPEAGFGYGAFSFCNSLQSITIKNMNWIVNGFIRSCPALESIRFLGACQGSGEVESGAIQGPLGNCTLELLSSVETIDNTAFEFCSTLTSIIIHKPANSIPGAPWGAENAAVSWIG